MTFSKIDWGTYIISIAKTVSKKIGTLIHSMKFLSPEVVLYLFFNWDSLHARLNSDYKAWKYKKKKHKKIKAYRKWLIFAIDVKMDGSVFEEKSFKMLQVTFSSKLDWGTCIISIAKTASKKIGALKTCVRYFLSIFYFYIKS